MQLWRRYWKYCPDYLQERMTVLNTVSCVVPNVLNFDNDQLTEILLYDKEDLDNINNTTINYLIETKRFATQLIWCSLDVMALTSRLHLKFMFLLLCFLFFVFVFAIFIFLVFLGYFFHILYAFFFYSLICIIFCIHIILFCLQHIYV